MNRIALISLMLFVPATAGAHSVLFYEYEPTEKIEGLPDITEKRIVGEEEFVVLTADELAQYDVFFVDEYTINLKVLESRRSVIAEAVAMGMSLYVQSQYRSGFRFVPGEVSTQARRARSVSIPLQSAWHPMILKGRLFPEDLTDGKNMAHVVFEDFSAIYTSVAQAEFGSEGNFPVILAGRYGLGKIILRSQHYHSSRCAKARKLNRAIMAWLTDWEDRPLDGDILESKNLAQLPAEEVEHTLLPENQE